MEIKPPPYWTSVTVALFIGSFMTVNLDERITKELELAAKAIGTTAEQLANIIVCDWLMERLKAEMPQGDRKQ